MTILAMPPMGLVSSRSMRPPTIVRSRPAKSPSKGLDHLPHHFDVRGHGLRDHCSEQILLGGEIEIERPLGDAGSSGDVIQSGGGEATLGEHLESRDDDLAGPGLLAAAPTRQALRGHGFGRFITDWSVIYILGPSRAASGGRTLVSKA